MLFTNIGLSAPLIIISILDAAQILAEKYEDAFDFWS